MKPCVCGGSNANCRYCSGSGSVTDSIGLPRNSSTQRTWAAVSEPVPGPGLETARWNVVSTPKRVSPQFLRWFLVFVGGWFLGFVMGLMFPR